MGVNLLIWKHEVFLWSKIAIKIIKNKIIICSPNVLFVHNKCYVCCSVVLQVLSLEANGIWFQKGASNAMDTFHTLNRDFNVLLFLNKPFKMNKNINVASIKSKNFGLLMLNRNR